MAKRPRVANQISRRALLVGFGAAPFAARLSFASSAPLFLSCADDRACDHYVVGFDALGAQRFKIKLPARGHGYAQHAARRETIVFGRRRGSFAALIEARGGLLAAVI